MCVFIALYGSETQKPRKKQKQKNTNKMQNKETGEQNASIKL